MSEQAHVAADTTHCGGSSSRGLAEKITTVLFNHQVIAPDLTVVLKRESPRGEAWSSGSVAIPTWRTGPVVSGQFRLTGREVFLELDDATRLGPLSIGRYFRIPIPGIPVHVPDDASLSGQPGEERNTRPRGTWAGRAAGLVSFLAWRTKRSAKQLRYELRDSGMNGTLSHIRSRRPRQDLEETGGITYRPVKMVRKKNEVRLDLESYDRGGIIDLNMDTEKSRYPAQVPGDHYADAYAAYCFLQVYYDSMDERYLAACDMALAFTMRTYGDYRASNIFHQVTDFKNPVFIECVTRYPRERDRSRYEHFISTLTETGWYEPTNVFALRFHWHSARQRHSGKSEEGRIRECLRRIEQDQMADGLIRDTRGEKNPDARDLSYHQYSLACLARGLAYHFNGRAAAAFLKGCRFSLHTMLCNGEVSYTGRGANNIYHVASAIYAFSEAAKQADEKDEKARFARGMQLMHAYLAPWFDETEGFPAAMNHHRDRRMGWNHNASTYNALCAYLLYHAEKRVPGREDDTRRVPAEVPDACFVSSDSGYAMVSTSLYCLSFFAGCPSSFDLAGHKSGIAGMAALVVRDRGSVLPVLDHFTDGNCPPTTDLPYFVFGEIQHVPYGPGALRRGTGREKSIIFEKEYGKLRFSKEYVCFPDRIIMISRVTPLAESVSYRVGNLSALPFMDDGGWSYTVDGRTVSVRKNGYGLLYRDHGLWGADSEQVVEIFDIPSNPRGRAKIVNFRRLSVDGAGGPKKIVSVSELIVTPDVTTSDPIKPARIHVDGGNVRIVTASAHVTVML